MTFIKIHAHIHVPIYVYNCVNKWFDYLTSMLLFTLSSKYHMLIMCQELHQVLHEIQAESKEFQDMSTLKLCWWGCKLIHFCRTIGQNYLKCIYLWSYIATDTSGSFFKGKLCVCVCVCTCVKKYISDFNCMMFYNNKWESTKIPLSWAVVKYMGNKNLAVYYS